MGCAPSSTRRGRTTNTKPKTTTTSNGVFRCNEPYFRGDGDGFYDIGKVLRNGHETTPEEWQEFERHAHRKQRQYDDNNTSSTIPRELPMISWLASGAKTPPPLTKRPTPIQPTPPMIEENKKKALQLWVEYDGSRLEPALRSGAIALLDLHWLINYALYSRHKDDDDDDINSNTNNNNKKNKKNKKKTTNPVILPKRQDLPLEAFLSLERIQLGTKRRSTNEPGHVQIIALSYMWLHPSHPDPKGETLHLVARACQEILTNYLHYPDDYPCWGLLWDYASLFQHPDLTKGIYRTPVQEELFRQGLRNLSTFYSHPKTVVLQVKKFPRGYPRTYNLPKRANVAKYDDRGWPFVESCLASMVKSADTTHDLTSGVALGGSFIGSSGRGHRQPPLTLAIMGAKLSGKSFTNAKDDRLLVMSLYEEHYSQVFDNVTELRYNGLLWTDAEIKLLSEVLRSTRFPMLKALDLSKNNFGDEGSKALANALISNTPPNLEFLKIGGRRAFFRDPMTESSVGHLAPVFVRVKEVYLISSFLGLAGGAKH